MSGEDDMKHHRATLAVSAAVLAAAVLTSFASGATRTATLMPDHGPVGTAVHVSITDSGPHLRGSDLAMWPHVDRRGGVIYCAQGTPTYPLGAISWTGVTGTADVVVPDVPAGEYDVVELLPEVSEPCMPVGIFTVSPAPDTAMPITTNRIPTAPVGALLVAIAATVILARSRLLR
jgi:hypothetical protein